MDLNINLHSSFIQGLYDANSIEHKFEVLEDEVRKAGFDGAFYSFIPTLSLLNKELRPVVQYSKNYEDFYHFYKKHKVDKNDLGIRLISEGKTDIIDWCDTVKKKQISKDERRYIITSRTKFGIRTGISFPTLSNEQGIAAVNIVSQNKIINLTSNIAYREKLENLKRCARIYHDHTMVHHDCRYKFILPVLNTLSDKKKIVLKFLISGKPMKNISSESDITVRYAEKLLCELRKSFGNISTNELIYLVGLLNISEYI